MEYALRLGRLRLALQKNNLDWLTVTHLPNIRYLCGFTGSAAVFLVGPEESVLLTDGRYRTQAKEEVKGAKANVHAVRIVITQKAPLVAAGEWLASRQDSSTRSAGQISVGIEPESMTVGMRERMAASLKRRARLRPAPPFIERARMVKDAAEIVRLRRAVELGASLFRIARQRIRPGATEVSVAAAMEYEARNSGAEGLSFSTIIASGPRSAIVHGRASRARIPRRGFVVCDFGVILAGYCSDRTRTVHVGRPSGEAQIVI